MTVNKKVLGRTSGRGLFLFSVCELVCLASAAADRRVVEAQVASATRRAASLQAVAALLQDFGAGLVTAGAADADAVLGVLALADTKREVALAHADAVAGAAATAEPVAEHAAEVL